MSPSDPKPVDDEHPVIAAMRRAPRGERLPPELKAFLDEQLADIKAGRARLVPHEEVMAPLRQARTEEEWRALADAELEKIERGNEP